MKDMNGFNTIKEKEKLCVTQDQFTPEYYVRKQMLKHILWDITAGIAFQIIMKILMKNS